MSSADAKSELVTHSVRIAEIACATALSHFRKKIGVEFKADDSPVTLADRAVEEKVRAYLKQHFPAHGIFGEEGGIEGEDRRNMWIIDPIDGTRSFLSGHPLFGLLLGHLCDGTPDLGLIAMPCLNEVILGVAGQGATLNGDPISCSGTERLDQAVLFINEGEKLQSNAPDVFSALMKAGQTRRLSYDCYPHALVAMGHVDAVIDYDLQPYDFLPVAAVVEAAGGVATDWTGNRLDRTSDGRVICAATPALHAQLLKLVGG